VGEARLTERSKLTRGPDRTVRGSAAGEDRSASAPGAISDAEREAIAAEILDGLEERGVPPGAWLVDLARVRDALQSADALLRRMEEAIIRAARESPRAEP
jgi:hypothetical protein